MSKKLLSEAQLRRFAKLANLTPINEWGSHADQYRRKKGPDGVEHRAGEGPDGHYKDYEGAYGGNKGDKSKTHPGRKDYMQEDAFEDVEAEVDAELPDGEEVEMGAGEEEIVDTGEEGGEMDLGSREEMAMDVISAVADALNIEVDIDDAGGEEVEDVEVEDDLDVGGDEMEIEDEEEMVMEALRGITYVPGKKEIVNEVAKRVARRLLKAKKAEQSLQEALGNSKAKPKVTRRRRTKK